MMHLQTHTDWGTASLTMAWKLTEQEMKETDRQSGSLISRLSVKLLN
jgi:hypothetical protein